jgi:hypothetical protein
MIVHMDEFTGIGGLEGKYMSLYLLLPSCV